MTYCPWLVAYDLPGIRLVIAFIGVQSFLTVPRLHQFGVVAPWSGP
jgi:hypothetical protein|nr:MAG TPA: hypothetical protein [Caudoviricetes sp.]DAV70206.1 MAG TPA: hypothetical protein [Caudoviricetes sp.]